MNTRKSLLALAAIPILAIGACGQKTEDEPTPNTFPQSESPAQNEVKPLKLGEEITIKNCNGGGPCEVKVTFDDIKLFKTCPQGVLYSDIKAMDPEGSQYLTVSGKFEVVSSPSNFSLGESDFQGVSKDGVAAEPGIAQDCEDLGVDQNLDNPVDPGLTRKGELTMAVKPGMEKLRFSTMWDENTYEFDMSKLKLEDGSGEVPGYAMENSDSDPAPATPNSSPEVIGCIEDECWEQEGMSIEDQQRAATENFFNSPEADSLAPPLNESPRADGCVGAAYICGYYDQDGNPIDVNKQTGETTPR